MNISSNITWGPTPTRLRPRPPKSSSRRSSGIRTRPRASSTWWSISTSAWTPRRFTRISCCRPRPGTRRTTSTPPTCTPSSTRCRRRCPPAGSQRATGTSSRGWPKKSVTWPKPICPTRSARSSRCPCSTTPRPRWPSSRSRTGPRGNAHQSPARPCPDWWSWNVTTRTFTTASSP